MTAISEDEKTMMDAAIKDIEENGKMTIHLCIDTSKMLEDNFNVEETLNSELTGIFILAKKIIREYKRRKLNDKKT